MFCLAESDVPGAPTNVYGVQLSRERGTVRVAWTAPEDNNSTITHYEIRYTHTGVTPAYVGAVNTSDSSVSTSVNVTGLSTGSGYTFNVRAINSFGWGAESEESDEVYTFHRFGLLMTMRECCTTPQIHVEQNRENKVKPIQNNTW